jgi:LCP family protein required for cell wall assembly
VSGTRTGRRRAPAQRSGRRNKRWPSAKGLTTAVDVPLDDEPGTDEPLAATSGGDDGDGPIHAAPTLTPPERRRPKDPLWAKLIIFAGILVMAGSGLTAIAPRLAGNWASGNIEQVNAIPTQLQGHDISGPINFLLLGLDQREGEEADTRIRADSIILVHIPAAHDVAYMISFPRDSLVEIPEYDKTRYPGGYDKINAAFANGAVTPDIYGDRDSSATGWGRGAELTMLTISNLVPGGLTFNGAAIINFSGFESVLQVLGPITLCVDEEVYSIHYLPDGQRAYPDLNLVYGDHQKVGKHYPLGCQPMQPWEALDYSRQRYGLSDGDYGRQRHQQQLLKAIMRETLSPDTLTNFSTMRELQKAAGGLLTLDLGGNRIEDWALTLSSLGADDIVMIKTNGGEFHSSVQGGTSYEYLSDDTLDLLQHVQSDTVLDFLTLHSDWVASDH